MEEVRRGQLLLKVKLTGFADGLAVGVRKESCQG